ncbi:MAG: response regulator [Saprospiraceae bacterium]|nr:response regulator [Saprospiraceae bacterium]
MLEDDPVIALDLRLELERQGCQVLIADDAPAALRLCKRHLPNLALLNFALKPTDGMALARLLHTRYLTKVLFITGARPKDVEASKDFYAGHEVLHKPFTRRQLRSFLLP